MRARRLRHAGGARAALRAASGADVRQGCAATGIEVRDGRIASVETTAGRIETDIVVCCAGVGSREVGALAGVELPVEGIARSMWFTPQDGGLPERVPLTIDFSTGFYFHREGPGLAFGGRERSLEDVAEAAARRLPVLAELPVQTSWWGWLRRQPGLERARRRGAGRVAVPLRHRLLRARLPAGACGRRARRRARRRPRADARPLGVLRGRFAAGAERPETFVV